jgi:AAA+ superfamily predicted ATPase
MVKVNPRQWALESLIPALKRLDDLLEQAVVVAQKVYGEQTVADHFRGLHIGEDEVFRLLHRKPAEPLLYHESDQIRKKQDCEASRLQRLKQAYDLSAFDLDLILIALAPELDLKYERLYAYLQDDITRKRPTVDLALNLLCASLEDKLERRNHFASDTPLMQQKILHLIPDPNHTEPPLLSHYLKLDDQIVRFLLSNEGLDSRLASFCRILKPQVLFETLPLCDEIKKALPGTVNQAREEHRALGLYFQGPEGAGKRKAAQAIASRIGAPLLIANVLRSMESKSDFDYMLRLLFRQAWFLDAIVFLDGADLLFSDDGVSQYNGLLDVLSKDKGITILAGTKPWVPSGHAPSGVITVHFDMPDFDQRKKYWQARLKKEGIRLNGNKLELLAGRFSLRPGQIADAAMTARNIACWRASKESAVNSQALINGQPSIDDLFIAARLQTGYDLSTMARKIEPSYIWDDIVLPEDTITQLHEICQWVTHRYRVLGEWGFDKKLSMGKGVNALFAGPSGTGKTMAADIIANELKLDLYKIDLAGVVSKYIGETEKNLGRIFQAAENANVILFFDEADALFGKRSEVRDSHDRYANIETNYLLQKMEEYEGIAILASNLRQNLDESFMRRMAFTVHFPFPDDASRQRIWAGIWPCEIPLADDMDFGLLARRFKLSGGNVKNIALAAAYLAADDGGTVNKSHLLQATRREYQKMGKNLTGTELYGSQMDV